MKRYLLITIDTEEEFNWHKVPFLANGNTVSNVSALRRLQEALAELNGKITYFADFPVLKDKLARGILTRFYEHYGAEIGTHLHPWCNPPFEEELNSANTMTNMLPTNLVRSKLETLTELFVEVFGFRPVSYRAGRFAFDAASAKIISELGYKIDSSVTPFYDWSKSYGPNFFFAPLRPYFIDGEDIFCENKNGQILEVPISAGFNRVPFKLWSEIYWFAKKSKLRHLKLVGTLDRSHLLKRITLGPEFQSVEEMKSLVKNLCREKVQVFNMIFHSSSLIPGGNSIISDPEQVSAFEKRVMDIISWMLLELNVKSINISDLLRMGRELGSINAK